ncbi:MAG: RtcB family protein, partial [Candidatus Micrarchaeota archaeon]|nr:RtcB family protein [Candidatus Micrarchaeota archaeon]
MGIRQAGQAVWEMEREGAMRVCGRIFATPALFESMGKDRTFEQLKNVACLPGIVKHALLMPDGHEGYGFPIGGVAGFDMESGVISPGGVGYDINCGVRLIATPLSRREVEAKKKQLIELLFKNVPSGVGSKGKLRLSQRELDEAVVRGVDWAVERGYGTPQDKERT